MQESIDKYKNDLLQEQKNCDSYKLLKDEIIKIREQYRDILKSTIINKRKFICKHLKMILKNSFCDFLSFITFLLIFITIITFFCLYSSPLIIKLISVIIFLSPPIIDDLILVKNEFNYSLENYQIAKNKDKELTDEIEQLNTKIINAKNNMKKYNLLLESLNQENNLNNSISIEKKMINKYHL